MPSKLPPALAATRPSGCTSLKLRQLSREVNRLYDGHVGASGMKTTQYSLLSHVVKLGPIRPSDLAAALRLDASTLTRNLQPLVTLGWIEQGPGEDARSRRVAATASGRAQHIEARQAWKQAQAALHERLGMERVQRLHALIDECMALLSAGDSGDPHE